MNDALLEFLLETKDIIFFGFKFLWFVLWFVIIVVTPLVVGVHFLLKQFFK